MPGPMRGLVRRALLWGVGASVILPIVMGVVVGLGGLLHALGDGAGARGTGRVALVVAVAWLVAVIATSLAAGLAALERDRRPRRRRRHGPRPGEVPRRRRRGPRAHRERIDGGRRPAPPDAGPD